MGRGHRNGLKWQRKIERERQKEGEMRMLIADGAFCMFASMAEQR